MSHQHAWHIHKSFEPDETTNSIYYTKDTWIVAIWLCECGEMKRTIYSHTSMVDQEEGL